MKKIAILAASAALFAAPALADQVTLKLESSTGEAYEIIFDQKTQIATIGDTSTPYTYDTDAKQLCSMHNGEELCLTFAELGEDVGFTTTYTASNGNSGTATITAVTE